MQGEKLKEKDEKNGSYNATRKFTNVTVERVLRTQLKESGIHCNMMSKECDGGSF